MHALKVSLDPTNATIGACVLVALLCASILHIVKEECLDRVPSCGSKNSICATVLLHSVDGKLHTLKVSKPDQQHVADCIPADPTVLLSVDRAV